MFSGRLHICTDLQESFTGGWGAIITGKGRNQEPKAPLWQGKLLQEDESPEKDWALRLVGMENTTESTLTY